MIQKMMRLFQSSSRLIVLAVIVGIMAAGSGCKSKKKAMEAAAAAEKAKIEQEAELRRQKDEEARREAEERAKREAEARSKVETAAPRERLEEYFGAIANSGNAASANRSITEALTLFASDETPVLILISESGGIKDYDRPTTIKQYLEYLKDTKKNMNKIGNLQFDSSGKITEVELIK